MLGKCQWQVRALAWPSARQERSQGWMGQPARGAWWGRAEIIAVATLGANAVPPRAHQSSFGVIPGLSHYTLWLGR